MNINVIFDFIVIRREGASVTYWPSFDFSGTGTGTQNIGHGFYPPHICVFDDPELYFKPLFQIDLAKGYWKEPRKFQLLVTDEVNPNRLALWFLIKNNLYLHGFDVESGTKLSHYALKDVSDFACPTGKDRLPVVVILECNGKIRLGWLDIDYKLLSTSVINISSIFPRSVVMSLDTMLFGDTIVCTLKTSVREEFGGEDIPGTEKTVYEKASIQLRNYKRNGLIRKCFEVLKNEIPSNIFTRTVAKFVALGPVGSVEGEWDEFAGIIREVLSQLPQDEALLVAVPLVQALDALSEVKYYVLPNLKAVVYLFWLILFPKY
jgi:hypothetical protein